MPPPESSSSADDAAASGAKPTTLDLTAAQGGLDDEAVTCDPSLVVPLRRDDSLGRHLPLNGLCNLEDWDLDELVEPMRQILPYFVASDPIYPKGSEHRKHWEFAKLVVGLRRLGVLGQRSWILGVGAGQEEVAFYLTNEARWVFATDIYGEGSFSNIEADNKILFDPDSVARCPYNRRRLVVQQMNALDLRYEDASFDATYSLSSIEHFGGMEGARNALAEQRRVLRPGGIAAFTTEVIVNGAPSLLDGNLMLFTPTDIESLCGSVPGLALVEPIDFSLSEQTRSSVIPLAKAVEDAQVHRHVDFPHIVLEHRGRQYTSISIFLRAQRPSTADSTSGDKRRARTLLASGLHRVRHQVGRATRILPS